MPLEAVLTLEDSSLRLLLDLGVGGRDSCPCRMVLASVDLGAPFFKIHGIGRCQFRFRLSFTFSSLESVLNAAHSLVLCGAFCPHPRSYSMGGGTVAQCLPASFLLCGIGNKFGSLSVSGAMVRICD